MAVPRKPVTFLARDSYRQRRLRDVAWVLPVVGAVLFCVPLLWPRGPEAGAGGTSSALTFLFLVWFGMIVVALWLARSLAIDPSETDEDTER